MKHPFFCSRTVYIAACATVAISLIPIGFGAMTTTANAGMAFLNWPNSDEYTMVGYPWFALLQDIGTNRESYDKFLEHGHRLAGMLIGFAAIGLTCLAWGSPVSRRLQWMATGVLIGVIIQGILGGFRVLEKMPSLAMLHGLFASLVFSLMCSTATMASAAWNQPQEAISLKSLKRARSISVFLFIYLIIQYALGGLIRHPAIGLRSPVHEHLGLGLLALVVFSVATWAVFKTKNSWLRQAMAILLAFVGVQVLLGLLTYAVKFGVPSLGIIAVADSASQVIFRTSHMVVGVLVIGASAVLVVKSFRACSLAQTPAITQPASVPTQT